MKLLKIKNLLLLAAVVFATTAEAQFKQKFTAAEQQQISIATPGLFSRSDAFNVDFSLLKASEYSFPLPVGKATVRKNNSVEIVTKDGDAVKAMFDGTVRLSRKHPELGNVIVIRHRNGFETVYGNNVENLVEVGTNVRAGQTIAIVGHKDGKFYCDFSIMVNGARINPSAMIDVHSHRLHRQTLLCEKSGDYVNVSVLGDKTDIEESATDMEMDVFEKSSTFKWNLEQMEKERWAYPLPGAKVISPYGGKRRHAGVDLKTKANDEIVAAFDGVVTRSSSYYVDNARILKQSHPCVGSEKKVHPHGNHDEHYHCALSSELHSRKNVCQRIGNQKANNRCNNTEPQPRRRTNARAGCCYVSRDSSALQAWLRHALAG